MTIARAHSHVGDFTECCLPCSYITSDCDADADVYNKHHYYATPEETVAGVLKAGTDVDCTSFVGKNAQSALDKKLITEDDIDVRLVNLMKVRLRLGHFDPPGARQARATVHTRKRC